MKLQIKESQKKQLKEYLKDVSRNFILNQKSTEELNKFLDENSIFSLYDDENGEMVFGIKGHQVHSVGETSYVCGFKTSEEALACKLFFDNFRHFSKVAEIELNVNKFGNHKLPYVIKKNMKKNNCDVEMLFDIKIYDEIFESYFYDEDSGFTYGTKTTMNFTNDVCCFSQVNLWSCMSLIILHEYFKSL